jgi:cell division protein FtsB
MSRCSIRPSHELSSSRFCGGMALALLFALFVAIFQFGAWYQRNNVAIGHYCTQDMSACWYEVDFTN